MNAHVDEPAPDYKFSATLSWEGSGATITLPCRLFLPRTVRDRPRIITLPDGPTWNHLLFAEPCKLTGVMDSITITGTGVTFGSGTLRVWRGGLDDGSLSAYPQDLTICKKLANAPAKPTISFRLTQSDLLSPFKGSVFCGTGQVRRRHGRSREFSLCSGCTLRFANDYRYVHDGEVTTTWPELIATARLDSPQTGRHPLDFVPLLDDLLLLVSLAEGRRCACLEVSWSGPNASMRLFRLDRALPDESTFHRLAGELISGLDLGKFLRRSYRTLQSSPHRNLLWGALASITSSDHGPIGTRFLRHFTAFESLVLAHRRENNLEFSLPGTDDRNRFMKELKRWIKSFQLSEGEIPSERRVMLYENLPNLARVSFRRAAENLFQTYSIEHDDLWPLFDTQGGCSLVGIRNAIVHGEALTERDWSAILEAERSLEVLVYRVCLSLLGWDYKRSRARWNDARRGEWRKARALLPRDFHSLPR